MTSSSPNKDEILFPIVSNPNKFFPLNIENNHQLPKLKNIKLKNNKNKLKYFYLYLSKTKSNS